MIADGSYGVVWDIREWKAGKRTSTIPLGVCKATKKIAFIGMSELAPLIISHVYIENQVCADGRNCLNLDCPFCTTTWRSYRDSGCKAIDSHQAFKNLLKHIHEAEEQIPVEDLAQKADGTIQTCQPTRRRKR